MDDNNIDKKITDLPLCKNCLKLAIEGKEIATTSDFVELLKQANVATNNDKEEVDIFGYTRNWEQISKAYRSLKDFTCERCSLKITNIFDQHFIHVHHKNGNKLDNRTENLECLCIRCHANVDKNHSERLKSGANKILYDEFMKKYNT